MNFFQTKFLNYFSWSFLIIALFSSNDYLSAQNDTNDIQPTNQNFLSNQFSNNIISFTKQNVINSSDSLLFNVLKLENTTEENIKGIIKIVLPDESWGLDANLPTSEIEIAPGELLAYPLWISIPKKTIGDATYVISAKLIRNTGLPPIQAFSYVVVPRSSDWSMRVDENLVYFLNRKNTNDSKIILTNNGNATENIALNFQLGENISLQESGLRKDQIFIELRPGVDTSINLAVRYDKSKTDRFLRKDVKSSSMSVNASNGKTLNKTIYYKKLESIFIDQEQMLKRSPLTISAFSQNILGAVPTINVFAYGNLLLKNERQLNYSANFFGIQPTTPLTVDQFWLFANYNVSYHTPKLTVSLGDLSIAGTSMASFGRGITTEYRQSKRLKLGAGWIYNVFLPIASFGAYADITPSRFINLHLGASRQQDQYNLLDLNSYQVSGGLHLGKYNSLSFVAEVSERNHRFTQFNFPNAQDPNQSLPGSALRLGHAFQYKNFYMSTSAERRSQYFVSPLNGYTGFHNDMSYKINARNSISLNTSYDDFQSYFNLQGRANVMPRMIFRTTQLNYMRQINNRLIITPHLAYKNHTINSFYPSLGRLFNDRGEILNAGLRANIKLPNDNSINASYIRGIIRPINIYQDQIVNTNLEPFYQNNRLNLSYSTMSSGISLSYIEGVLVENQFRDLSLFGNARNIMLRAYTDKYYFDRSLVVNYSASYLTQTGNSFENVVLMVRPEWTLPRGWKMFGLANYLFTRRKFDEENTLITQSFILSIGITKKFDIQQPRTKYYDLKLVFFKDLNGNGERDENELLLENIVVEISKNKDIARLDGLMFNDVELISNEMGEIEYIKIPEGSYIMKSKSLVNLRDIFAANGNEQVISIKGNTTIYVPYIESFKVTGKIKLKKQNFSSAGLVKLNNVAVTALSENGNHIKTLTDNNGMFRLYVPPVEGLYKVSINNVFGEEFFIEQEEYLIDFSANKTYEIEFNVIEKERGFEISDGGYQFKSLNGTHEEEETETLEEKPSVEATPPSQELKPAPTSSPKSQSQEDEIKVEPSGIDPNKEKELNDKIDDLQRQIDELKKLFEQAESPVPLLNQPEDAEQNDQPQSPDNQVDMSDYDELGDLINQLIERTNPNEANLNLNRVSFRVKLGVFKEQVPVEQLNKLIQLGTVETGETNDDGSSNFISKPIYDLSKAQLYKDTLERQGFQGIEVIGDYAGREISVEEAERLLEEKNKE